MNASLSKYRRKIGTLDQKWPCTLEFKLKIDHYSRNL